VSNLQFLAFISLTNCFGSLPKLILKITNLTQDRQKSGGYNFKVLTLKQSNKMLEMGV
jgi:hypothetical protein